MSVISVIAFPLYLLRQQAVIHQLLGETLVPIGVWANGTVRGCSWNRIIASHHQQNPTLCRAPSILFRNRPANKNGAMSCRTPLPPPARSYTAATRAWEISTMLWFCRTWTNYGDLMPVPPHLWHLTILSPFLRVPFPSQFLHGFFFSPTLFRMLSSKFGSRIVVGAVDRAHPSSAGTFDRRRSDRGLRALISQRRLTQSCMSD